MSCGVSSQVSGEGEPGSRCSWAPSLATGLGCKGGSSGSGKWQLDVSGGVS